MKDKLKQLGMNITDIAHLEGLNAGLSGIWPLEPLVALKEARDRFHRAASEWQNVLQRVLVRGYTPVTSDVIQLWNSVRNKLVLAKHNKTTKKAGKYSSMSMARSMALLASRVRCSSMTQRSTTQWALDRAS